MCNRSCNSGIFCEPLNPPQPNHVAQFAGAQLGQPALASTDDRPGEPFLAFDHIVDHLLQGADGDKFVHLHLLGLADAESAVSGLVFYSGVPPAVEMENVVGAGQVQASATCFEGEDKNGRTVRSS